MDVTLRILCKLIKLATIIINESTNEGVFERMTWFLNLPGSFLTNGSYKGLFLLNIRVLGDLFLWANLAEEELILKPLRVIQNDRIGKLHSSIGEGWLEPEQSWDCSWWLLSSPISLKHSKLSAVVILMLFSAIWCCFTFTLGILLSLHNFN